MLPHEPALRRYLAAQKLPTGIDADDIVQEVYGAFADMPSVDEIRDVRHFMIGVGRKILLMQLRRARVVSIRSVDEMPSWNVAAEEPSPEDQASDRQQLHLLALAIASIKEPWRSAFLLRVANDLTHKEIGVRLGMSENAVQKSHAKTLSKLAMLLGRGGNGVARATEGQTRPNDMESDGQAEHARRD